MADKTLSQHEIEELLSTLAGGPAVRERRRTIKPYDFRRPDKFSKEHLRALRILSGSFARILNSSLTSHLRTAVQARPLMVEQMTYDEYIRSLANPTLIFVVSLAPLPGQAVLELNLPVARAILDRLLGGTGDVSFGPRDLTDIELALLRRVGTFLTSSLKEAWANVAPLQPVLQEPVLTPEFVYVTLPRETTATIGFEVTLLKTTGALSMCLPYPVLQPVLDNLTSQVWVGSATPLDDADDQPAAPDQLSAVALPLAAELGNANMTLRDLLNVSTGTIIKLDTAANGPLPIRVGGHVKFSGRPGVNGRNLAIQVERILG